MSKTLIAVGLVAAALAGAGMIFAVEHKNEPSALAAEVENTKQTSKGNNSTSAGRLVVPQGTTVTFLLASSLSTKTAHAGDEFSASIASPVSVGGVVAIPVGARVAGHVLIAEQPGKASGRGVLQLSYDQVTFGGHTYDLGTQSQVYQSASGTTKDVALIGGGAAAGAVVGAVIGGGGSVGKGAAAGAVAGTGASLLTRGPQLTLERGMILEAHLDQEVRVRR
jgi:hypothetical protein